MNNCIMSMTQPNRIEIHNDKGMIAIQGTPQGNETMQTELSRAEIND